MQCDLTSYSAPYFIDHGLSNGFPVATPPCPLSPTYHRVGTTKPMADIENQSSLPTRKSSFEGTTREISPRNSTLQPETPLIPAADDANNRLRAWLTVFGGFLALFCSFGQLNAFGTFQTWYSTHQLVSKSLFSISWIGSLQLWTFFFMVRRLSFPIDASVTVLFQGGPIGCAFDAYGPTPLLCSGSVILVASLVLTSVSIQYYQYLLTQGILFGLGVAMMCVLFSLAPSTNLTMV